MSDHSRLPKESTRLIPEDEFVSRLNASGLPKEKIDLVFNLARRDAKNPNMVIVPNTKFWK